MEYIPYTYLIGWSKMNLWYYGAEYGEITKIANPSNLWRDYYTSSSEVKLCREFLGEPDIIQIRKKFTSKKSCIEWEQKVLSKMKVKDSEKWLNLRSNKGVNITLHGRNSISKKNSSYRWFTNGKTDIRINLSKKNVQVPAGYSPGRSNNVAKKGEGNFMFGRTHSTEAKEKISIAHKGKTISEGQRKKLSEAITGRTHSTDTKNKMKTIKKSVEWNLKNSKARQNTKIYINQESGQRKYFKIGKEPKGWFLPT